MAAEVSGGFCRGVGRGAVEVRVGFTLYRREHQIQRRLERSLVLRDKMSEANCAKPSGV